MNYIARHMAGIAAIALVLLFAVPADAAAEDPVAERIREEIEEIRLCIDQETEGSCLASTTVLVDFYEQRSYRPAWGDREIIAQLLAAVKGIERDGLDPDDYHAAALERLNRRITVEGMQEPTRLAGFDLLLTDSLVRLVYHLVFGKEDPLKHNARWNLDIRIGAEEPVAFLEKALASGSLAAELETLRPRQPVYEELKWALARYRGIRDNGGWEAVPEGGLLRKGDVDERMPALRRRLQATGDLAGGPRSTDFDEAVRLAVLRFQARHHLRQDGVVGKNTLSALNVSVQERIDQIRVNLERLRWVLHKVPDTYLIVDIAGFRLFWVEDGIRRWTCRTQVGKPYRQTPVFKSWIEYLVFNPTWTVPPTILARDMLPAVRKDENYLAERHIRVIDGDGNTVDPATVNWAAYSGRNFPYVLRQDPGPHNALGRIKFIFPNAYHVYLHDTPSRELFDKNVRASSSGCVRVEKPLELARILLNDPSAWGMEDIVRAIDSRERRTVRLPEPVPILLLYITVHVEEDGRVCFLRDIYERDESVLRGLNGRFTYSKPPFRPVGF